MKKFIFKIFILIYGVINWISDTSYNLRNSNYYLVIGILGQCVLHFAEGLLSFIYLIIKLSFACCCFFIKSSKLLVRGVYFCFLYVLKSVFLFVIIAIKLILLNLILLVNLIWSLLTLISCLIFSICLGLRPAFIDFKDMISTFITLFLYERSLLRGNKIFTKRRLTWIKLYFPWLFSNLYADVSKWFHIVCTFLLENVIHYAVTMLVCTYNKIICFLVFIKTESLVFFQFFYKIFVVISIIILFLIRFIRSFKDLKNIKKYLLSCGSGIVYIFSQIIELIYLSCREIWVLITQLDLLFVFMYKDLFKVDKLFRWSVSSLRKIVILLLIAVCMFVISFFFLFSTSSIFGSGEDSNSKTVRFISSVHDILTGEILTPTRYKTYQFSVNRGDTLSESLKEYGVSNNNISEVISKLSKKYNLRSISSKWIISLVVASSPKWEDSKIEKMILPISDNEDLVIDTYKHSNYVVYKTSKELVRYIFHKKVTINGSVYESTLKHLVPQNITTIALRNLSWDLDFTREIREGDTFDVVYECSYTKYNKLVNCDNLLYLNFNGKVKNLQMYQYNDVFYHEDGKSVAKTLIKTPLDKVRLTSGFGYRKHPILGYTMLHTGNDFGAPIGTPVYASGNGIVVKKYKSSSYGNYLSIQHNPNLRSAYAHLNGFAKDLKVGDRVKQFQVIGYVGATGRATGPHLHYEVWINNKPVNSLTVRTSSAEHLSGISLVDFLKYRKEFNKIFVRIPATGRYLSPIKELATSNNQVVADALESSSN